MVREGVTVHDTHVLNTFRPSLLEVVDQQVSLLIQILQSHRWIVEKLSLRVGLSLPHCMTWMYEGVVPHVQGGEGFDFKVGYPIP